MKAIRTRIQKSSRPLVILLATVVVILTSMVVANATQTITTPNAMNVPFSLAAGADSAPITPANNKPVLVMGCSTTSGDTGVGQANLLHIPSSALIWVGLNSGPNPAIGSGGTGQSGAPIVSIDANHLVQVRTGATPDTIRVHNGLAFMATGTVTLIW